MNFGVNTLPFRSSGDVGLLSIQKVDNRLDSLTNHNIYKSNYIYNNALDIIKSDSSLSNQCYIIDNKKVIHTKPSSKVFTSSTNYSKSNGVLQGKELIANNFSGFTVIPLMIAFLLFVRILQRYGKYLSKFFEGLLVGFIADKIVADLNVPTRRLLLLLDAVSLVAFSYLAYEILLWLNPMPENILNPFLILGAASVLFLVFRIYVFVIHKIIAHIISNKNFTDRLYYYYLVTFRTGGFILYPVIFLVLYGNKLFSDYIFYASLGIFGILLVYRFFLLVVLFIKNNFSLLYFILYLCVLEFVPILILVKEVQKIQ